jgi:hypothetical protein
MDMEEFLLLPFGAAGEPLCTDGRSGMSLQKNRGVDLSKTVRDMVTRGRILLAVERYKKGEASLRLLSSPESLWGR